MAVSQPQAISGLGGIGKTQLALEYAYQYVQSYDAVLWVRADTREALTSGFVNLATLLRLPARDQQEQPLVVQAVKEWLRTHDRWLLILDNADDLALISEFLPQAARGHLLLTTREQSMGRLVQPLEIDVLDQDTGAIFLLRRARIISPDATLDQASTTDAAIARQIVQEMGGLPLVLDQAGAYIEATGCSLSDYLHFYRTRGSDLRKERGGYVSDHPEPVATTWSVSFEKVEQRSPAAADLLRLCAFLYPDAIPEEIITKGAERLGPHLQGIATDHIAFNQAIQALLAYSLLSRNRVTHTLAIHRLVQAVIKDAMSKQVVQEWVQRTVQAVEAAFPTVMYEAWPECERLLPHALACWGMIRQYKLRLPEAAALLRRTGWYLLKRARYNEAKPLLRHALAFRKHLSGPTHPDTASSLNDMAELLFLQGKYEQAELHYQRALAIRERMLGPEHPDMAHNLNYLADLYNRQGKYEQAEPLLQRALAIYERVLGPEHPDTASSLATLADLYYAQGKYEQAEPLLQRALAIYERMLGSEHSLIANVLTTLGDLYYAQGKYEQAELLYQRALAIRKKTLGAEHRDIAFSLYKLANLYYAQSKYEQAEPLYQQATKAKEQGNDPSSLVTTLQALGNVLEELERDAEALQVYEQCVQLLQQLPAPGEPRRLSAVYHRRGRIYEQMKQYEQALEAYQQALRLLKVEQEPHFYGVVLHDIGDVYQAQEQLEQALSYYQQAAKAKEQGDDPSSLVSTLEALADVLEELERDAEALQVYEQCVQIFQELPALDENNA